MAATGRRLTRLAQVHIKAEAADGTYLEPDGDGTNIFMAMVSDSPMSIDSANFAPDQMRNDFLVMDETPGSKSATINFQVLLKGSGTAGTQPEFDLALKACGLAESDITSSTLSNTYFPTSIMDGSNAGADPIVTQPAQSYSVSVLENGTRYAIAGAVGNVVLTANVGEQAVLDFTMTGAYQIIAADALESPTYQAEVGPAFMGATFATNFSGAYPTIGVTSFSFDLGNTISVQRDVNSAHGVFGAKITGRRSTGSFDPEALVAGSTGGSGGTGEFYPTIWEGGTSGTISMGPIGAVAGGWNFDVHRAILTPPELASSDGIRKHTVGFTNTALATDSEGVGVGFSLEFI